MDTKACTTCGQEKPLEEFRRYPGETGKRYPYCLECQSIETRRKYLELKKTKKTIIMEEEIELQKINELYMLRVEKGLRTLGSRVKHKSVKRIVDKQIEDLSS